MVNEYLRLPGRALRRVVRTGARTRDRYFERFEHPYLLLLVPIGGILLSISAIAELSEWQMTAAFMALYAMVAFIICLLGYTVFYSFKFGSQTLRWWRFRDYDTE